MRMTAIQTNSRSFAPMVELKNRSWFIALIKSRRP